MHADHQRAEFAVGGLPAADHDLMAGAAFGLGPAVARARTDRAHRASSRRCLRAPACRPIAARHRRRSRNARHSGSGSISPCRASSSCLQALLALAERQAPQIVPLGEQQVEGEEDQSSVLPSDSAACSAEKSGAPLWSSATTSPSIDAVRQLARLLARSPGTCRSSRGPCGSSASPRRPRRAAARGSRRT